MHNLRLPEEKIMPSHLEFVARIGRGGALDLHCLYSILVPVKIAGLYKTDGSRRAANEGFQRGGAAHLLRRGSGLPGEGSLQKIIAEVRIVHPAHDLQKGRSLGRSGGKDY